MAIKTKLCDQFMDALIRIEEDLKNLSFYHLSTKCIGDARFVRYVNSDILLDFLFGPSDWDIDMILYKNHTKYGLNEMLQIDSVRKWFQENRYENVNERDLLREMQWYLGLLKVFIPYINH